MANCAVCREDIERGTTCPRCGSDNSNVQDLTLGYFGSIWAILSFLLIFAPLFMLLPGVFSWANEILQPVVSLRVAGPIALLITLIVAFFMFSMREELHEGALTSPFKEKPNRSLPIWALVFFLLAVLLAFLLGFAITTKHLLVGAPGDWNARLQGKLVFGGTHASLAPTGDDRDALLCSLPFSRFRRGLWRCTSMASLSTSGCPTRFI